MPTAETLPKMPIRSVRLRYRPVNPDDVARLEAITKRAITINGLKLVAAIACIVGATIANAGGSSESMLFLAVAVFAMGF